MDPKDYAECEKVADRLLDLFEAQYARGDYKSIEAGIKRICAGLDARYRVSARLTFEIFDETKNKTVILSDTGVTAVGGEEPMAFSEADSADSYIVDGEVVRLPHSYCPVCWDDWETKIENKSCPSCGAAMGAKVKLLLDTGICPHCGEGKVSRANPACPKCFKQTGESEVHWG